MEMTEIPARYECSKGCALDFGDAFEHCTAANGTIFDLSVIEWEVTAYTPEMTFATEEFTTECKVHK